VVLIGENVQLIRQRGTRYDHGEALLEPVYRGVHASRREGVPAARVLQPASSHPGFVLTRRKRLPDGTVVEVQGAGDAAVRGDCFCGNEVGAPLVKELASQTPARSTAAIHRQVTAMVQERGWDPPSYARVRQIIKSLNIACLEGAPETKVSRVWLVDLARLAGVSKPPSLAY